MNTEQEMYLTGDEDGTVSIQCRRKGCMVEHEVKRVGGSPSMVWLEIPMPYDATPRDIDRAWMQHRVEHARLER